MLKKLLCLVSALTLVCSAAACGKPNTSSSTSEDGNIGGFMNYKGGVASIDKSDDGVNVTVDTPETPSRKKSILESKNYNGKKFKILYWYTPDDSVKRTIEAFNKAHNAKLELVITSDELDVAMAKSIAAGDPYDVVAAHGNYFPQSIFQNLYEPLESYISEEDMFNSSNYDAGGLSKLVNDRFAYNGHYYALGSHKSCYLQLCYYNKKMFMEAGLEDPWELYKKGRWTWDKVLEQGKKVTDIANGKAYWSIYSLVEYANLNGVSGIKFENNTYSENIASADMIKCAQEYQALYKGNSPIGIYKDSGDEFSNGNVYMIMNTTDSYTFYFDFAKNSTAFAKDGYNMGVVPVPYGPHNTQKTYSSLSAQGYGSTRGAKDPSIAACYALFESKYVDNSSTKKRVPQAVLDAVQKNFATNPFIGYTGFKDSSGKSYTSVMFEIGQKIIRDGADPVSTINNNRQVVQNCITNSVSNK